MCVAPAPLSHQCSFRKQNPPRCLVIPSTEKVRQTTMRLGSPVFKANSCSGPLDSIRTVRPSALHSLRLSTPLPKLHGPTYCPCRLTSSQKKMKKKKKEKEKKVPCLDRPTEYVTKKKKPLYPEIQSAVSPSRFNTMRKRGGCGRSQLNGCWTERKKLWQRSSPRCSELTFHHVRKLFVASH